MLGCENCGKKIQLGDRFYFFGVCTLVDDPAFPGESDKLIQDKRYPDFCSLDCAGLFVLEGKADKLKGDQR